MNPITYYDAALDMLVVSHSVLLTDKEKGHIADENLSYAYKRTLFVPGDYEPAVRQPDHDHHEPALRIEVQDPDHAPIVYLNGRRVTDDTPYRVSVDLHTDSKDPMNNRVTVDHALTGSAYDTRNPYDHLRY